MHFRFAIQIIRTKAPLVEISVLCKRNWSICFVLIVAFPALLATAYAR